MMRKPKRIFYIAALLVILLAGVSNYLWIKADNSIEGVDSQNHLLFSIEFFYSLSGILQSPISLCEKAIEIIDLLGRPAAHSFVDWPNGLNLNASLFYSFFGKSLLSAKSALLPYLFILLFSTYLIGRLIWSDFVGFFASFILFMYPIIFESSRQFQLDFPLAAMAALNILLLLKCDYFKNRKYSFLFGLSLGWAMLIKGQVLLFITWPLLLVLYKSFNKEVLKEFFKSPQLYNIVAFALTAGLIASIWWGRQVVDTIDSLREHIFSAEKSLESYWPWDRKYSFSSVSFHFMGLFSSLGPFFYIAFLLSFLSFLKQKIKFKAILLGWLIPPFLLFSLLFTIKHTRFLMPALPVVALITAQGLHQIKNRKIRIPVLFVIIVFAIVQYYILSYGDLNYEKFSIGKFRLFRRTGYTVSSPHKEDLKIDEIVKIIKENKPPDERVQIGLIFTYISRPIQHEAVYWLKMKDNLLDPIELTEMDRSFYNNFDSFDFILFSVPSQASLHWPEGKKFINLLRRISYNKVRKFELTEPLAWDRLLKKVEDAKLDFRLIEAIPLDKRAVYYIYKRKDKNR